MTNLRCRSLRNNRLRTSLQALPEVWLLSTVDTLALSWARPDDVETLPVNECAKKRRKLGSPLKCS